LEQKELRKRRWKWFGKVQHDRSSDGNALDERRELKFVSDRIAPIRGRWGYKRTFHGRTD